MSKATEHLSAGAPRRPMMTDNAHFCAGMIIADANRAEKAGEPVRMTPGLARIVAGHLRQLADRVRELKRLLKITSDTIERLTAPRADSAEDFRSQLTSQLEQLRCGNADVGGTVTYIMDLIGNTKLVAVDAMLAEEVRKLRIENGHLQYVISTTAQPSKPVEEVCPTCKGQGLTGWDKPIGSPPSMVCVPQFCFCEKGRSLADLNAPDAKRTIVSSIPGFEGAPPSATDDEQVMRDHMQKAIGCPDFDGYLRASIRMVPVEFAIKAMRLYAARVRAEERERCAKIAEARILGWNSREDAHKEAMLIAAAIRAQDRET